MFLGGPEAACYAPPMPTYRLVLHVDALSADDRAALATAIDALGFPTERWGIVDGARREGQFSADEWNRLEAGLQPWASQIELQVSSA